MTNETKIDFSAPYQALRQSMLGFFINHVGNISIAEDLLQEVFLKAIKASENGHTPLHLTGWLYGIAKNALIDFYRAKRPTQPLPDGLVAETIEDTFLQETLNACLQPMINELPSLYKNTLQSIYFENKTMQSIADQEKISLSAIKSRASRGREILKKNLLDCCQIELSKKGEILDVQSCCQSNPCNPIELENSKN
jgi:RNA polymerase sigma-70 factor (ECF subfamily)